jgi:hypothetical protein
MSIGIIGAGTIGLTLPKLWSEAGHEVHPASRHPELNTLRAPLGGRHRCCLRLAGSKPSTPSTSRRFRVRLTAAGNTSAYLAIRWSPMARELWSGCKSPQPCPSSVDDDRRDLVRLCGWILKSQGVERATEALSVRALKRLAQNVAGDLGSASLPSAPATLHPMARR